MIISDSIRIISLLDVYGMGNGARFGRRLAIRVLIAHTTW